MIPGHSYRPADWARAIWQRRWMVLTSFAVVAAAAVLVAGRLPDRYRASALIVTVPQGVSQEFVRATVTNKTQIADRLPTIREQILSRARLEPIILDLNLYAAVRRTSAMEAVIEQMRKDIVIEIASGSGALRVSYETGSPEAAMRGAERIAAVAIEENQRDRAALARGTSSFLKTQLEDSRAQLEEQEKRLEAYRQKYGPELPSQFQSNMQATQTTQMQIQALNDSLIRDRDRRLQLTRQIADLQSEQFLGDQTAGDRSTAGPAGTAGTADTSIAAQLQAALAELRVQEAQLRPEHPDLIRIKRRVSELQTLAKSEAAAPRPEQPARLPSAAEVAKRDRLRELQAEVDTIDRQMANRANEEGQLRHTLEMYRNRVEALPARESELASLTRDTETLQASYRSLLAKREDAKIAEDLEQQQVGEQFKIADPPRYPERPISPNRRFIDLAGAVGGLVIGIGIALLLEMADTSLRTEFDVLALGLPLLSVIPFMPSESERRRSRRLRAFASVALVVLVAGCAATIWLTFRL